MTITPPLLAMQAVQTALAQSTTTTAVSTARSATQTFVDEPTMVDIPVPTAVLSKEIVNELLSYDQLQTSPQELARFSHWLNEKHLGVRFFTKAVEYLVDMRREDRASEEEVTLVRKRPALRIA
jgi:hypothetical protein